MKKNYMAPSVKVVEIESEALLETSTLGTGTYSGQDLLGNDRDDYDDEEDLW